MDTSFSLRIDGNARQWSGNNSPQGDRHNRRRQKLQALLQALKAGELDAARMAFNALINFDPSVSSDPYGFRRCPPQSD
jgi:Tfp pilus assembly protein PilF